jgi:hypothetical protein
MFKAAIEERIEEGFDINEPLEFGGLYLLNLAVVSANGSDKSVEIIKFLLDNGADVNAGGDDRPLLYLMERMYRYVPKHLEKDLTESLAEILSLYLEKCSFDDATKALEALKLKYEGEI